MENSPVASYMCARIHSPHAPPSTVLTLSTTVKTPISISPVSVLIRVSHATLNPGGSIFTQLIPFIFRVSPASPKLDFAETTASLGSDIPRFHELNLGTTVFGSVPISAHTGSHLGALAEYVVVSTDQVTPQPENASLEDVSGWPVAGSTALEVI